MIREEKIALLIDELEDIRCNNFDTDTDEDKTLKEVIRVIKALKQESKKSHWIPVNVKLPKVEQYALITVHNQTKMCWYQNGVFLDGEQNAYTKENEELVAWMPLPEPYKLSEIPTGSDDELYSDCIDAFKEYALGRK